MRTFFHIFPKIRHFFPKSEMSRKGSRESTTYDFQYQAKKGRTRRTVFAALVLSVAANAPQFGIRMEYAEGVSPPLRRITFSVPWAGTVSCGTKSVARRFHALKVMAITSTAVTTFTMVLCVYFDVRTVVAYKALSSYRRKEIHNDACLFGAFGVQARRAKCMRI